MNAQQEAEAIFNWYFAQLARASGLKWSDRNAGDIARAVDLLSQAEAAPLDEVPPYQPVRSDRVTQVFEREPSGDYGDPNFERWRQTKRAEEERDDVRRMARREGGTR